jgi:hypothetical protein
MPVPFPQAPQLEGQSARPFHDVGDFLLAMANQRHQEQAQARDFELRQQAQKRADQLAGLQDERLAEQHRVSMAKEARLKAADKLDFVNKYQGELGAGEFQRAEARKNTIGPELGYSETWKPPAGQPPQFPDSPEAQARLAGDAAAQEQARMATQRAEAEQALAQGVPPEEGPLQDPRFAQRQAMAATPPAEGMETSEATLARASLAGTQAADAALADRQRMLAQRGPWNMLQAAARARVDEGPMQTPESARATAEATAMTPEMLAKYAEEKLNYPSRMAAYQAGGQRTGSFDGGPGFTMDMSSLRYSAQMADANDMKTVLLPRGANLASMFQGHAEQAKTREEKALFSAAAEIVPSFIDNLIGEVKSGTLTKEKAGAQFNASYDKILALIMKPGMSFDQKMALVRAGARAQAARPDVALGNLTKIEGLYNQWASKANLTALTKKNTELGDVLEGFKGGGISQQLARMAEVKARMPRPTNMEFVAAGPQAQSLWDRAMTSVAKAATGKMGDAYVQQHIDVAVKDLERLKGYFEGAGPRSFYKYFGTPKYADYLPELVAHAKGQMELSGSTWREPTDEEVALSRPAKKGGMGTIGIPKTPAASKKNIDDLAAKFGGH